MLNKDWTGNSNSIYKTLGASNHTDKDREDNDWYATEFKAIDLLLEVEKFNENIWECACVDSDTEILTREGWISIENYEDQEILISDIDRNTLFEKPLRFIKSNSKKLYKYKSNYLDMCLSDNHRVLYKNNHNVMKVRSIDDIVENHTNSVNGFKASIPISFIHKGNLIVDDNILRLAVAIQADGTIRSNKNYIEIRVKKNRKKERIEMLLNKANISYNKKINKDYSNYYFYFPFNPKLFPKEWYDLCYDNRVSIVDEVFYWDGTISKQGCKSYSTNVKSNADFIQFCICSIGYGCNIIYDCRNDSINYRVNLNRCGFSSISNTKSTKREFEVTEGDYNTFCFTVRTGFFVCRRNNKVFVTGNCGDGILSKRLEHFGHKVKSTDLIYRGYGEGDSDFLQQTEIFNGDIITNPPYKIATDFIYKALELVPDGNKVAMFLKIQFLEGKARKKLFETHPPKVIYVSSSRLLCAKNADFEGMIKGGGSAVCYAWYVWQKSYKGDTIIKWIN